MNGRLAKILFMTGIFIGILVPTYAGDDTRYFIRLSGLDIELEPTTQRFDSLLGRHFSLDTIESTVADYTDSGVKLTDAMKIHRFFAIEVGAAYFGQYTLVATTSDAHYDVIAKMYAVQAGLEARFPLRKFTFYGKLSASYWREEYELIGPEPPTDDDGDGEGGDGEGGDGEGGDGGTAYKDEVPYVTLEDGGTSGVDFSGEVGLEFQITYGLALCISYEETEINGVDVEAVMAGLTYKY